MSQVDAGDRRWVAEPRGGLEVLGVVSRFDAVIGELRGEREVSAGELEIGQVEQPERTLELHPGADEPVVQLLEVPAGVTEQSTPETQPALDRRRPPAEPRTGVRLGEDQRTLHQLRTRPSDEQAGGRC
jgi:hypothetical protein